MDSDSDGCTEISQSVFMDLYRHQHHTADRIKQQALASLKVSIDLLPLLPSWLSDCQTDALSMPDKSGSVHCKSLYVHVIIILYWYI